MDDYKIPHNYSTLYHKIRYSNFKKKSFLQEQWWSNVNIHKLHQLQWWVLGGLNNEHFLHIG